jgi:hypothetical protein
VNIHQASPHPSATCVPHRREIAERLSTDNDAKSQNFVIGSSDRTRRRRARIAHSASPTTESRVTSRSVGRCG